MEEPTVSVTLMFCEATPGEDRMIWPVYVPDANPAPFAVTINAAGVVAFNGVTVSQFWPWLSATEAANVICAPLLAPLLVTFTVCDAGGVPFVDCANVSELDETLSVFEDVTFNVTWTNCGLLATPAEVEVIVTVPV